MERSWTVVPVWIAFWAVTILLDVGGDLTRYALAGAPPPPAAALLTEWGAFWGLWLAVSPLSVLLALRLDPDRVGWSRAVVVHAVGACAVATIQLILAAGAWTWLQPAGPGWVGRSGEFFASLFPRNVMIHAALAAAVLAWRYGFRTRARELDVVRVRARNAELELEARTAQLDLLRRDLRPHVLFNALNAVSGMVRSGESDRAVEYIARLGSVLRTGIEDSGTPLVPMREELGHVWEYLAMQEVRLGDRLRVTWQVADEGLDVDVPRFLLQPLVENAVVHGLDRADPKATVDVAIRVERAEGRLRVVVDDTGPGPDGGGAGVGLGHTRRRLALLYGTGWRLEVEPGPTGGARSVVEVPISVAR